MEQIHPGGHFMKEDELPKVLFPDNYYYLSKQLSEFLRHKADKFCRVWPDGTVMVTSTIQYITPYA